MCFKNWVKGNNIHSLRPHDRTPKGDKTHMAKYMIIVSPASLFPPISSYSTRSYLMSSSARSRAKLKLKKQSSGAPITESSFLFNYLPRLGGLSSSQMKGRWVTIACNRPLLHPRVCSLIMIGCMEKGKVRKGKADNRWWW